MKLSAGWPAGHAPAAHQSVAPPSGYWSLQGPVRFHRRDAEHAEGLFHFYFPLRGRNVKINSLQGPQLVFVDKMPL